MTDITFRSDIVAKYKDHMGGDASIIEAMLVCSDLTDEIKAEIEDIPTTRGRIRFLMRKRHGTPFEHNAMKFYVEAPIFVFREWHRHRIGFSYNEQSARYSELPPMFYVPPFDRPLIQQGKPGNQTTVPGTPEQHKKTVEAVKYANDIAYKQYKHLLDNVGVANEVARLVLPVNIYSKMVTTLNARSLMAFLSLRTREEAMWLDDIDELSGDEIRRRNPNGGGAMYPSGPLWEIEQAARMTEAVFADLFPITYEAFCDFGRVAP